MAKKKSNAHKRKYGSVRTNHPSILVPALIQSGGLQYMLPPRIQPMNPFPSYR